MPLFKEVHACKANFAIWAGAGSVIQATSAISFTVCQQSERRRGSPHYLYHIEGKTWHGMDGKKTALLRPLLLEQPYIEDVIWCPNGHEDHNLNGFRDHRRPDRNLADMHLATHGLGSEHRYKRWLRVQRPISDHKVIFARTFAASNRNFPWKVIHERYAHEAVFLGLPREHEQFEMQIGRVKYVPTEDFLHAARIIAGSQLYVGGDSALSAIAEGLKHLMIVETPDPSRWFGGRFERLGRINVRDEWYEFPEVCGKDS